MKLYEHFLDWMERVHDEEAFDVGKDFDVRLDASQDMSDIDFDSRGWLNEEQTPYCEIHVFGSLAPQGDMTPTVYGNHKTSTPLPDPYQTTRFWDSILCLNLLNGNGYLDNSHIESYVLYRYTKFGNESKWGGCNSWFIPLLKNCDDRAFKYADGSW
nr:hypothetical protein [Tanacetum cinerariifolium]